MLEVYKTRDLANVRAAGLVGLSPAFDPRCKRFLDDLKEQGVIDQRVFSFFITDYFEAITQVDNARIQYQGPIEGLAAGSKLVIGGYDVQEFTPEGKRNIHWIDVSNSDQMWTADMKTNSVMVGMEPFGSNAVGVVFDSGTSFIITPTHDYTGIMKVFKEKYGIIFRKINQHTLAT